MIFLRGRGKPNSRRVGVRTATERCDVLLKKFPPSPHPIPLQELSRRCIKVSRGRLLTQDMGTADRRRNIKTLTALPCCPPLCVILSKAQSAFAKFCGALSGAKPQGVSRRGIYKGSLLAFQRKCCVFWGEGYSYFLEKVSRFFAANARSE